MRGREGEGDITIINRGFQAKAVLIVMVTVTIKLWTVWKHIKEGKCNCVGKVEG